MKKVLLLGLTMFGVVALTGCEQINALLSGEKQYNYADFKALLADRKLSFDVTKATASIDEDGVKSTIDYTYNPDTEAWDYTYFDEDFQVQMNGTAYLDIVSDIKTCELAAGLVNSKVDNMFKFYAAKKAYRFTGLYETSNEKVNIEYKFGEDGLRKSTYIKNTDLNAVKSKETKESYVYSK